MEGVVLFMWYVLSLGAPDSIGGSQLSGEVHGVMWLGPYGNVRLGLNKAWLTVKASIPAAVGMGVRPSATRYAPRSRSLT